jgi:DNA polymerase III alpha subunit
MIPFFVSDFSIGRSILKLEPSHEGGPKDIMSLAEEASLKEIFLVEDNMTSFLPAQKICDRKKIPLRYGVRFNTCNDATDDNLITSAFKVILFALNDTGCKQLFKLFTDVHTKNNGWLDEATFKQHETDQLLLVHPFYDSYIYHNTMSFRTCLYDPWVPSDREIFTVENNGLPFDDLIRAKISKLHSNLGVQVCRVQTILYTTRSDVEAYQVYRIACGRRYGFANKTLDNPDLNHFGSDEFCFQSYMEKAYGKPFKI